MNPQPVIFVIQNCYPSGELHEQSEAEDDHILDVTDIISEIYWENHPE